MSLLHRIFFTLTVCFLSLSLTLGSFTFYATNTQVVRSNLSFVEQRIILQNLKEQPYTSQIDYRYSLIYLLLQTLTQETAIDEFSELSLKTLENISTWLRGESETIRIELPTETDEVLTAELDANARAFIEEHKARLDVCTQEALEQTQQNGYSPNDFCIPAQVRNGQVNFTTYVNAGESDTLDDLVAGDLASGAVIDPAQIEFLRAYSQPRTGLVFIRASLPFLVILSILLLGVWYYSQKLQKEDLYLGIIRLLGYVAVSVISLAIFGIFVLNENFLQRYFQLHSLPGLNPDVIGTFAQVSRGVVIDGLAPSFILGGLLSIVTAINYFVYNQRKIVEANDNELFQLHERDIYDQSVLLARKPSVPAPKPADFSQKQLAALARIKDQQAAQNYRITQTDNPKKNPPNPAAHWQKDLENTLHPAPNLAPKFNKEQSSSPKQPTSNKPVETKTNPTLGKTSVASTVVSARPHPNKTVIGSKPSKPLIETDPKTTRRIITF